MGVEGLMGRARHLFEYFLIDCFSFYVLLCQTGGGVLAHTILGVDFNDQTGDIRLVCYYLLQRKFGVLLNTTHKFDFLFSNEEI